MQNKIHTWAANVCFLNVIVVLGHWGKGRKTMWSVVLLTQHIAKEFLVACRDEVQLHLDRNVDRNLNMHMLVVNYVSFTIAGRKCKMIEVNRHFKLTVSWAALMSMSTVIPSFFKVSICFPACFSRREHGVDDSEQSAATTIRWWRSMLRVSMFMPEQTVSSDKVEMTTLNRTSSNQ